MSSGCVILRLLSKSCEKVSLSNGSLLVRIAICRTTKTRTPTGSGAVPANRPWDALASTIVRARDCLVPQFAAYEYRVHIP